MYVDEELLQTFENGLNPAYPEQSGIRPAILGYGEISTTFSIPAMPDLAFKRMPPFESLDQITDYKAAVNRYCGLLTEEFGIQVADYDFYHMKNRYGEHILYVAQARLPEASIGHRILKSGSRSELEQLMNATLEPLMRLYKFNRENTKKISIGLDGQLSNWSFQCSGENRTTLIYFDITTPMFRMDGRDLLDTEIFLKSCPSFLVWLVRWQFLTEVLDRYHDVRMILVDLVGNFLKEGRDDLIEHALHIINDRLESEKLASEMNPLNRSEIDAYYKNDAFIWTVFLSLRRFDRFLKTRILRQRYNFMLPGKIQR
ncbi:MAG: hypothetical protein C4518_11320 [Desulfobacteraceae bacterium]|nr:MAG: hypothetical protein C4518_11320 [Desulfobacteraceae bacterium]